MYVKGEVAKPGRYPLTTNMHVEDLVRTAGGLRRSADPKKADLTHYAVGSLPGTASESVPIELAAALSGAGNDNLQLRDGDVLTIRQAPGWNDIGASATVRGEVQHAGSYGIRTGERLSSLLERAGGFSPEAYPYGAVLMRQEVRELQMQSYLALVQRMKAEEINLKALPDGDQDQKNAKLTAIAQTETALNQLEANAPIGRVVVHIQPDVQQWRNTSADIALRDGDVLVIPKKANYVLVSGQVFNPTAISHRPGRSAKWYLNQAGGLSQMADKKAVFVVRADGSVLASQNNSGWWSGDPLNSALRPGDSIVVPEKAPKNRNPELGNSSPGGAASDFCGADDCLFQAVTTEVGNVHEGGVDGMGLGSNECDRRATGFMHGTDAAPPQVETQADAQASRRPRKEDHGKTKTGDSPADFEKWQISASPLRFRDLRRSFLQDQKQIWTSPMRLRFSDTEWLVPFAGITAGLLVTDRDVSLHLSHDADDHQPLQQSF